MLHALPHSCALPTPRPPSTLQVSSRRRPNESDADWAKRQEAARQEVNSHLLVFIHGALQALTAIGLLQVGGARRKQASAKDWRGMGRG